jgi:hypothetical protein
MALAARLPFFAASAVKRVKHAPSSIWFEMTHR